MPLPRRRLLQSLTLAAPLTAQPPPAPGALRAVSTFHGSSLSDARLETLAPILERRRAQLESLRSLELPDDLSPIAGPLHAQR